MPETDTGFDALHRENPSAILHEADLDRDPHRQFETWLREAIDAGVVQPLGMSLATATPDGRPSSRLVLLRGHDERGFVFYTNYESRKAIELEANPWAALTFYWPELERQVRIEGRVTRVSDAESDAYFRTRPRGSQIGALASPQSRVILDRETLDKRMAELEAEFAGREVPRPRHWGGYRVLPDVIEFWQGRSNRLHDRLRYRRNGEGKWILERLGP